ncbi:MAG: NPCBM/NEW2 domain-containing protein [Kiritimatiellia bacterium]
MTLRLALLAAFPLLGLSAPVTTTRLSELDFDGFQQGWQRPRADQGVSGEPLSVGGEPFDTGIGTHAPSSWTLTLAGKALEFRAAAGVNDGSPGEVEFIVRGDGRDLYRSGPVRGGEPARPIRVPLAGVQRLDLIVDPRGLSTSDHADWLDPVILHTGALLLRCAARPLPGRAPAPRRPTSRPTPPRTWTGPGDRPPAPLLRRPDSAGGIRSRRHPDHRHHAPQTGRHPGR